MDFVGLFWTTVHMLMRHVDFLMITLIRFLTNLYPFIYPRIENTFFQLDTLTTLKILLQISPLY